MSSIAIQQFPCCRTLKEFAQAPHCSTAQKVARAAAAVFLAIPALIADLIAYIPLKIHNARIQPLAAPVARWMPPLPSAPPMNLFEPSAPPADPASIEPPALKLQRDTDFLYPLWFGFDPIDSRLSLEEGIARNAVLYFINPSDRTQNRQPDFFQLSQVLSNGTSLQTLAINSRYLTDRDHENLGAALMASDPSHLRADLQGIYRDIIAHARILCQNPHFQAAVRNIR